MDVNKFLVEHKKFNEIGIESIKQIYNGNQVLAKSLLPSEIFSEANKEVFIENTLRYNPNQVRRNNAPEFIHPALVAFVNKQVNQTDDPNYEVTTTACLDHDLGEDVFEYNKEKFQEFANMQPPNSKRLQRIVLLTSPNYEQIENDLSFSLLFKIENASLDPYRLSQKVSRINQIKKSYDIVTAKTLISDVLEVMLDDEYLITKRKNGGMIEKYWFIPTAMLALEENKELVPNMIEPGYELIQYVAKKHNLSVKEIESKILKEYQIFLKKYEDRFDKISAKHIKKFSN